MTAAKTKTADGWPPGAGLDLGDDIAGEALPCPPRRGTCDCQGHSFLRLARIKASRVTGPPSGPGVFNLLLVTIFLRSRLADQPLACIDLQPTMFDHIGFGRFDSRIIPFTSAYGLSALLRSIGDLMDFVDRTSA
jgi:hypothetical protein